MPNFSKKRKCTFIYPLMNLGCKGLFRLVLSRLFSINHYFVLKLNLNSLSSYPIKREPSGDVSIINSEDLQMIKETIKLLGSDDRREILARIQFYERGFQNCYIMKVNNKIAFIQWLIYPSENNTIRKYYKRIFYPLHSKQVMLENAFTFPEFRGYGYLSYVSRYLLNIAKMDGYKSAIGYVKKNKIASLNEFLLMGFKIIKLLKEQKIAGLIYRNL